MDGFAANEENSFYGLLLIWDVLYGDFDVTRLFSAARIQPSWIFVELRLDRVGQNASTHLEFNQACFVVYVFSTFYTILLSHLMYFHVSTLSCIIIWSCLTRNTLYGRLDVLDQSGKEAKIIHTLLISFPIDDWIYRNVLIWWWSYSEAPSWVWSHSDHLIM